MKKIVENIVLHTSFTQKFAEKIVSDNLEISRLDIDLAKQHIQSLYDSILQLETTFVQETMENSSSKEEELSDIDEFLLDLDEEFADTYAELELELGAKEQNEEREVKVDLSEEKFVAEEVSSQQDEVEEVVVSEVETAVEAAASIEEEKIPSIENVELQESEIENTPLEESLEQPQETEDNARNEVEEIDAKTEVVAGSKTLFDLFEEQPQTSLQDRVSHNKIDNIRSVIGINEKFRFINELFKGDMNTYNSVVDKLNTLISMDEAERFLVSYKARYDWEEEGEVYKEFYAVIERRY